MFHFINFLSLPPKDKNLIIFFAVFSFSIFPIAVFMFDVMENADGVKN